MLIPTMPLLCNRAGAVPDRAEFSQAHDSNHRHRRGAVATGVGYARLLGLFDRFTPSPLYADVHGEMMRAFAEYKQDVIAHRFPTEGTLTPSRRTSGDVVGRSRSEPVEYPETAKIDH